MTKEELLGLPRTKLDKWSLHSDLMRFEGYFQYIDIHEQEFHKNEYTQVEIFSIFQHMSDHRRGGWVNLVTFKGQDIFVTVRAGREGDDHHQIFFFDRGLFSEFVSYMRSFLEYEYELPMFEDDKMSKISNFYGYDLDKELLELKLPLKYKAGEIVNMYFPEFKGYKNLTLKAKVVKADPTTTTETYKVELVDFRLRFVSLNRGIEADIMPKYDIVEMPPGYSGGDKEIRGRIKEILKNERTTVSYNIPYEDEDTLSSL